MEVDATARASLTHSAEKSQVIETPTRAAVKRNLRLPLPKHLNHLMRLFE